MPPSIAIGSCVAPALVAWLERRALGKGAWDEQGKRPEQECRDLLHTLRRRWPSMLPLCAVRNPAQRHGVPRGIRRVPGGKGRPQGISFRLLLYTARLEKKKPGAKAPGLSKDGNSPFSARRAAG